MFAINPFAALSAAIPPAVMQAYIVAMIVLVAAGTLFDIVHKGSARYFFDNWRRSKARARSELSGGELASIAVQTAVVDVLASGEFCSARRRVAHLLTMYGFLVHVVSTVVMVFSYSTASIWPHFWWIGGLMVGVGGYWFWFFIRVDVAAEGNSPWRVMRADLFILSLLASVTLALIWAWAAGARQHLVPCLVCSLHHRNDGALRLGAVVEVRPHVLQARGGVRKESLLRERHAEQSARARRQAGAVWQRAHCAAPITH